MARDYLDHLSALSDDAQRVIDKMPLNFMSVGLICAAFPKARIIHVRRHPIDTCLSIYFQYLSHLHPYANDLDNLAQYYGEYLRLTNHWRAVLPATTLLEIAYEALIEDQELWTRRMLEFLGLPWDPHCLDFHTTDRTVNTLSKRLGSSQRAGNILQSLEVELGTPKIYAEGTDGSQDIHADDYRGPRPDPPHLENVEVAIHDGDVGDTDRAQINGRSNFHLAGSHIDGCSINLRHFPQRCAAAPALQGVAQRYIADRPLGAGIDDRLNADSTDPGGDYQQPALEPLASHARETRGRAPSPPAGYRDPIAAKVHEDAFLLEACNAENAIRSGHERRPDDRQAGFLDDEVTRLQLMNRN